MKKLIFLATCLLAFNTYACDFETAKSKAIIVQDNWVSEENYVCQLDSENFPKSSCVSASVKMLSNQLCTDVDEIRKMTLTEISKALETTEQGAYLGDAADLLYDKAKLEYVSITQTDPNIHKRLSNMLAKDFLALVIFNTKYMPHYESNESTNHCVVITGTITMPDGMYYLYKDPYLSSGITHMIRYDKFEKGILTRLEMYRNNQVYWSKLMKELNAVTVASND